MNKCKDMSLKQAQEYSKSLNFELYFDWDTPRTSEGFFQCRGSVEFCARRGIEFLKYADMLWMETDVPKLAQAKELSDRVKIVHPEKFLAYNLSPSFNWSKSGMSDLEIS